MGGLYTVFAPAGQVSADTGTSQQVAEGKALFAVGCASCHGLNGEGQQSGEVQGPSLAGVGAAAVEFQVATGRMPLARPEEQAPVDRKSTRLNSSHANISYAVFCLKKTKKSENISMSFLSTQPR